MSATATSRQQGQRAVNLARFGPLPLAKALWREQAVRNVQTLTAAGVPVEKAIAQTVDAFTITISETSLRRWCRAYDASGFPGMFEAKIGKSGRKPKGAQ